MLAAFARHHDPIEQGFRRHDKMECLSRSGVSAGKPLRTAALRIEVPCYWVSYHIDWISQRSPRAFWCIPVECLVPCVLWLVHGRWLLHYRSPSAGAYGAYQPTRRPRLGGPDSEAPTERHKLGWEGQAGFTPKRGDSPLRDGWMLFEGYSSTLYNPASG